MGYVGRTPTGSILTSADIADGSISTAKLADTAVSTAKIADDAVGNTKLDLTANYAFTGTVTGTPADVKLISTTTISGTPSTLEWKDSSLSGELDFSTYQYFTVNIHYFTHSSGSTNKNLYGRFIDASGNALTGSSYRYAMNSANRNGNADFGADASDSILLTRDSSGGHSDRSSFIQMQIQDVNKTGKKKMMTWYFSNENHDVTSHLLATVGTGVWTGTSNALGGWQIYFDGSSFENGGVIKLYGHK